MIDKDSVLSDEVVACEQYLKLPRPVAYLQGQRLLQCGEEGGGGGGRSERDRRGK